MLVLTRKSRQSIHVGNEIVITILKTTGSKVRLGIEAPRGVSIRRGDSVDEPPRDVARLPASVGASNAGRDTWEPSGTTMRGGGDVRRW